MDTSLSPKELDVQRMLACEVHIGTRNVDFQMERYVWRRRQDGAMRPDTTFSSPPAFPRAPPFGTGPAGRSRSLTPPRSPVQVSTSFTWARLWTS